MSTPLNPHARDVSYYHHYKYKRGQKIFIYPIFKAILFLIKYKLSTVVFIPSL